MGLDGQSKKNGKKEKKEKKLSPILLSSYTEMSKTQIKEQTI